MINFTLTTDQIVVCDVRCGVHSDKHTLLHKLVVLSPRFSVIYTFITCNFTI